MTADEISALVGGLPGVVTVVADEAGGAPEIAWGDSFFSYEAAKMPFATIVTKDYGDFDAFSRLDRPDVFRLNVEVGRERFQALVGYPPAAHGEQEHDYARSTVAPPPGVREAGLGVHRQPGRAVGRAGA